MVSYLFITLGYPPPKNGKKKNLSTEYVPRMRIWMIGKLWKLHENVPDATCDLWTLTFHVAQEWRQFRSVHMTRLVDIVQATDQNGFWTSHMMPVIGLTRWNGNLTKHEAYLLDGCMFPNRFMNNQAKKPPFWENWKSISQRSLVCGSMDGSTFEEYWMYEVLKDQKLKIRKLETWLLEPPTFATWNLQTFNFNYEEK